MKQVVSPQHFTSIQDFSKEDLLLFLKRAVSEKEDGMRPSLAGKILACAFFEPSTRTRLSFESAMLRLGGAALGFSQENTTSAKKGESLQDTIRTISYYADILVMRHPLDGACKLASEVSHIPLVSAGDGSHEHPTQTLIDLFTIYEKKKSLENLHVGIIGDLRRSRTCHSLALALSYFSPRLYFISPLGLEMPSSICYELKRRGVKFSCHRSMEESCSKWDVAYMTRLQKERSEALPQVRYFCMREKHLELMKKDVMILHPFPRAGELDPALDLYDQSAYFLQTENGPLVRQTLLSYFLFPEHYL